MIVEDKPVELPQREAQKLPNGDMRFTVTVPEYYASWVLAEAHAQNNEDPAAYFQRCIDWAISQDWLRVSGV